MSQQHGAAMDLLMITDRVPKIQSSKRRDLKFYLQVYRVFSQYFDVIGEARFARE
jgi:hypothetical protein